MLSFPIRLLESCSRTASFCLHSPQRQSNKGLRQRKRERETAKGKRWWVDGRGGRHRAGWKNSEIVKEIDEESGRDRASEGQIETVRKASNTKLDALGEETVY